MTGATPRFGGTALLMEMQEFATFSKGTQRYIRRSLDVGLGRRDAVARWARTTDEANEIGAQQRAYRQLDEIRRRLAGNLAIEPIASLIAPLAAVSAFDLGQGRLAGFAPYRFLYERLVGAAVRPWLPSAFCAAAALPHLRPERRHVLLASVGEAVGVREWSPREPGFVPEWVEKVDAAICA